MAELRRALITGAYGAIGAAIARQLAREGFEITLVGRDRAKLDGTAQEIFAATRNRNIHVSPADLSRLESIRALRRSWNGPLHALINNAAATPRRRLETPEGIEAQWATNVLGYHWMMREFADALLAARAAGGPARVINVASHYAGGLDLDDPEFKRRPYDNDAAYRQSKQANRMLTVHFAEAWKDKDVRVVSCHPGDVNSQLSNNLGFGGSTPPERGAETPAWLASAPDAEVKTGLFYSRKRAEPCEFGKDEAAVKSLAELCARYTELADKAVPSA
jgi:NAD(P)-dependent dehydrogenase (short-subunit alcohol dehydrogenase family)